MKEKEQLTMICPLCKGKASFDEHWNQNDNFIVDYRCFNGHLIQFVLPDFLFTLLVLNDTGDELYQLHFDADHKLTKLYDWERYVPIDLEGTGVALV